MQTTKQTASTSLLSQAKEGDTHALAKLMGGPLKAKGIQVSVDRKGRLLFISLMGQPCPPKQASLAFLRQGLEKLGLARIDSIRVSGYKSGDYHPLWVERMVLRAGTGQYTESLYKPQSSSHTNVHANAAPAESSLAAPRQSSAQGSEMQKSLLILGGLLLALLVMGLIIRAITGPAAPQNDSLPSQPTEQVEGSV